jgi:hypothetical protein
MSVASDHGRERHFETLLQHVGDGRHPTVKDDIAGFRQRLVLQIENICKGYIPSEDRSHQLEAADFRED